MKKILIPRHFINSEETLDEYLEGATRLTRASEISKQANIGIKFGLKLTVDESKLGEDSLDEIRTANSYLPHGTWFLHDRVNRGAGISFRQVLFGQSFTGELHTGEPYIVMLSCIDQHVIDTESSLEQLAEFADRMATDGALFGLGSRDVKVKLASNPSNSRLREIHELYHALTIGPEKLRVTPKKEGVSPAYAELGETTSGFFAINTSHPKYPELLRDLMGASQQADMRRFATEYFTVIRASQLGNIATGYVQSRENVFYNVQNEAIEREGVERLISCQTAELGKTILGVNLKGTLRREKTRKLSEFYDVKEVSIVRNLMKNALGAE